MIKNEKLANENSDREMVVVRTTNMEIGCYRFPIVQLEGRIPEGTTGNSTINSCFRQMSEQVDLSSSSKIVVFDFLNVQYDYGDHLGAFFWVLPALLDHVGIAVAANGSTLSGLKSLASFIGSWLPITFMASMEEIWVELRNNSQTIRDLSEKTKLCQKQVSTIINQNHELKIVLFGSRQTGLQFKSRNAFNPDSDMDFGAIGSPCELARLSSGAWRNLPNVGHPPSKLFSSAQEAVSFGFLVISN
jgi:hypothetical protein